MKKLMQLAAAAAMMTLPALAGGFWLNVGNAEANTEAKAMNALFTVMPSGCGEPTNAKVTATAEGMVNGKRVSQTVKLSAVRPGLYAVTKQWPAEGKWAVRVIAEYKGAETSVLVPVEGSTADRKAAKFQQGRPAETQIAAALSSN
ncbi:MAG: hypothetical protein HY821_06025 [Acidobacteria bacterium]|nr:hypothetical protein [Acidobacteriota bacterium]